MPHDDTGTRYVQAWTELYEQVCRVLSLFGQEDALSEGDYWVHDDYWGYPQVKVYINNLALLRPKVVASLQGLLAEFPGWEIVVAVYVPAIGQKWPDMGLTIRAHEIIDGLQRVYFPPEFQGFRYAGSKVGTERD